MSTWLKSVVAAALLVMLSENVLPKGVFRRVGRTVGGLTMMLIILQPLKMSFDLLPQEGLKDSIAHARQQSQNIAQEHLREETAIIEDRTAAYIEEKAAEMGLYCHAAVGCREQSGVPFPNEVTLDIPWDATLSRCICEELDIPPQQQHWQEDAK